MEFTLRHVSKIYLFKMPQDFIILLDRWRYFRPIAAARALLWKFIQLGIYLFYPSFSLERFFRSIRQIHSRCLRHVLRLNSLDLWPDFAYLEIGHSLISLTIECIFEVFNLIFPLRSLRCFYWHAITIFPYQPSLGFPWLVRVSACTELLSHPRYFSSIVLN